MNLSFKIRGFSVLLFVGTLYVYLPLTAQDQTLAPGQQRKQLSEVLKEVMNTEDKSRTLNYENLFITNDLGGITVQQYIKKHFGDLSFTSSGLISIPKNLRIINCQFDQELKFDSLDFKVLHLIGNRAPVIILENCVFNTLKIDQNTLRYELKLLAINIDKDLYITNNKAKKIILRKLITNREVGLGDNYIDLIEISESRFSLPPERSFKNYKDSVSQAFDLVMTGNTFIGDSASSIELRGNYTDLVIENNIFDVDFYLIRSSVRERFTVVGNVFDKNISFENFIFSETRNELYWDQFAGYKLSYSDNGKIYDVMTPEGFESGVMFSNLTATYKEMHKIFLGRGDLKSANACYSELKELQGIWHKYVYEKEGGFNNLFRWKLNRLLKIYTNHGTDPALAVVISFYVLLVFAIFYFFFPSEWDKKSKMKLISDYRLQLKETHRHNPKSLLTLAGIIFLSLLNAITLSLNSFVTLGFGTIPTRGVARYLCIIEGFLGWFLLSIFTVALINQVLA